MKFKDLAPSDKLQIKTQCIFSVLVYRISLQQIKSIPQTLSMLSSEQIKFEDIEGFQANGFWAGSGTRPQGPQAIAALSRMKAKRIRTQKILLFQDYPEEITGFPIAMGQSIFHLRGDHSPAGQRLPEGRLSLVLTAQPDTPLRGMANLQIKPLFQPSILMHSSAMPAGSIYKPITFQEGHFRANLEEGDFVVLAPRKIQQETNTFSWFFIDTEYKEPAALLYLILCQQAGAE